MTVAIACPVPEILHTEARVSGTESDKAQSSSTEAWEEFVSQYGPLLFYWARRLGLQEHDAADLVQDVLVVLVRKLPKFRYDPAKSFRGWLRTVLLNKWRDRRTAVSPRLLESAAEPMAPADSEVFEEREYRLYVLGQALRLMQAEFEPATWQACWDTVVCDRPAAEVARGLGVSVNAVYVARSRVLARLRRDLGGRLE
jgi:RNA polymerase sigma-70 factor, ECF subfamily